MCASYRWRARRRRSAAARRRARARRRQGGGARRLTVGVGTDAHADLAVEAHLISPWGTWEWMGPAASGVELPAAVRLNSASTSRHRRGWSPGSGGR